MNTIASEIRTKNLMIFTALLCFNAVGLFLAWLLLPPLAKFGSVLSFAGFTMSLIALLHWFNNANPESPTPVAEDRLPS